MSQLEVDKIIPQSGTSLTLGDSGDTFTIPSGVTLTNNGTVTGFGVNQPVWSVYNNGTQSVSHDTETTVAYNTERIDTDSAFDTSTYRFTVPSGKGGRYFIAAGIRFQDGAWGRSIKVFVNGSQSNVIGNMNYGTTSFTADNQLSGIIDLSASDYIEIKAKQHSGGSQNLEALTDGWYRSYFQGFKLIEA